MAKKAKKWEHKLERVPAGTDLDNPAIETLLERNGDDGWELVSVAIGRGGIPCLWFKREKE